jgi:hypothetical protein
LEKGELFCQSWDRSPLLSGKGGGGSYHRAA